MQFFETLLSLVTLVILIVIVTSTSRLNQYRPHLLGVGCVILALHLIFEVIRWQTIFTYLLFLILAPLLFKRSKTHFAFRLTGFVLGFLLLCSSVFLTSQFPLIDLPAPTGPHKVGTTSYSVTDETRKEIHSSDANARRELFVEVWYPAVNPKENDLPRPKTLWQELYTGSMDRVSFFMAYLKGIDTHSYPGIPVDFENGPYPVILYNHGLQMFTSQNTILMEHLASHGYVVISIAHPYESLRVNLPDAGTIIPEFITSMEKFNAAMAWIEKTSRPVLAAIDSIKTLESREKRAAGAGNRD